LDCRRVNLFIGEPNTGKSNILEALAFQALQQTLTLENLVRVNDLSNLFFENDPSNSVIIKTDEKKSEVLYEEGLVSIKFYQSTELSREFKGTFKDRQFSNQGAPWDFGIHPYFFKSLKNFPEMKYDFLSVPSGANLFQMLQTKKSLRGLVSEIVQERGFKLTLRQANYEIEISKEEDSILTAYPYPLISDTLQRIIFYIAAIETNKDDTSLVFEEPESNVFPYYAKYLAEKISLDGGKQYFITTHNPYFLQSLIQKTPIDDLQVVIVTMPKYETQVRSIVTTDEIEELIDLDSNVFLNLEKFSLQ
jgi:hypothetical protein